MEVSEYSHVVVMPNRRHILTYSYLLIYCSRTYNAEKDLLYLFWLLPVSLPYRSKKNATNSGSRLK